MLEANVLGDLGFLFGLQGRADQARHHFARSREIYEQLGPKHLLAVLAMRWGHAELTAGDPVAAEDELRRGKEILEQIGERSWLSTVMTNLASAVYEQGRYKEARRLAETAQELGATDDIATVVEALGVRAKASAREDDHERGAALLRQALRLVDETDMLWLRGVSRMDLAEFHRLTGPRNRGDRGRPAGSRALRAEAGGRPLRACSSIPLRTRSRRLIFFKPRRSIGSRRRGQLSSLVRLSVTRLLTLAALAWPGEWCSALARSWTAAGLRAEPRPLPLSPLCTRFGPRDTNQQLKARLSSCVFCGA